MGQRNQNIDDVANGDYEEEAFTELATALGMKALLKLITDHAITAGQAKLRIVVEDAVWEVSAKCLIRKGPWAVCGMVCCGLT